MDPGRLQDDGCSFARFVTSIHLSNLSVDSVAGTCVNPDEDLDLHNFWKVWR